MKFHNITMVGKFILEKLASLPVFQPSFEGRILYNSTNKKPYISTDAAWKQIGGGIGDLNTTFTDLATLEDGYLYSINTSSAPLTGYFDVSPNTGDLVSVYDKHDTFSTNNFTVYGNGNTINEASSLALSVDGTVASFIYDGNEWKANVGVSTSIPSDNIDFSSMSEITTMEAGDKFALLDATDSNNKKITLSNWFSNLNINSNLDALSSIDSADYFIIYETSTGITKKILASNVISDKITIKADNMSLDDTLTGSTRGTVFGIYPTMDFSTTTDGACWLYVDFPTTWNTTTDLQLTINYSLNGNDPSKTVRLTVDFWSVSEEDTPTYVTPDVTINNDITSSTSNIGKFTEDSLTAIGNAYLESGIKSFVIKLNRDISEDDYSGTLQLISVIITQ